MLGWNGPVERGQRLGLVLVPPWLNGALAFVRAALLALLALCVCGFPGRFWPTFLRPTIRPTWPTTATRMQRYAEAAPEETKETAEVGQTGGAAQGAAASAAACSDAAGSTDRT